MIVFFKSKPIAKRVNLDVTIRKRSEPGWMLGCVLSGWETITKRTFVKLNIALFRFTISFDVFTRKVEEESN